MADTKIDYSKLTARDVTDSAVFTQTRGGGDPLEGTPFVEWLTESHEKQVGKRVTVPAEHVDNTIRLLRIAGKRIGRGVRIVKGEPDGNGRVVVAFRAQAPKAYTPPSEAERALRKRDLAAVKAGTMTKAQYAKAIRDRRAASASA